MADALSDDTGQMILPSDDCPFCGYLPDDAARCPECGRMIPRDPLERARMEDSIRCERNGWIVAAAGFAVSALCIWLYGELWRAVMSNYYPNSISASRLITTLRSAVPMAPVLGLSYIALRMRADTRDRSALRYEHRGKIASPWHAVTVPAGLVAWIIPVIAMLIICSGLAN